MIVQAQQYVTPVALDACHLPRIPSGSVLIAITGQGKTRGTAAVLTFEATINQHIAFITPRSNNWPASPEYLLAYLIAAYSELRRISDDAGSTKGALTCADIRHFRVALPPPDEQRQILQCSEESTSGVNATIKRAQKEISLLHEYSTRILSDVVTGKLDVREAEANLPDETDMQDSMEELDDLLEADEDVTDDFDATPEKAEA